MKMKKTKSAVIGLCLCLVTCASSQKKIQQAKEKDPQYQYSMGAVYLNSNNLDEAVKSFNKALSLDPKHFQSLNALGLTYSLKGDLREAEKYFLKSLEVSPTFSEARNNLGMIYQEMGFLDKAEEEFKQVTADPNYPNKELPYYNLARLFSIRQEWEKALFYADKSVQTNPRYHLGFNLRGYILESQGKLPEAIDSYKQAAKLFPSDISYEFNLAAAYYKNGDLRQAGEILEEIRPLIADPEMREKADSYLKAIKEKEKSDPS
jgi:tetratricopeptide (TPR) repeat protein